MRKDGPLVLMADDQTVLPEPPSEDPVAVFALADRRCEVSLH